MRILFNHGITQGQLFAGSGSEVTEKDLSWFQNNFEPRYQCPYDYLGYIFLWTFDLIITHVIENKVRFTGPFGAFYIDFENFQEDEFIRQRQLGRMQDIDVVESDFTGYQLSFFYKMSKNDDLILRRNLYLGKKHKKQFLDKVNSGEPMYSIKDVNINYFMPQVYEKFPRMTKAELRKIINRGLSRMYYAVKQQCYFSMRSKVIDCTFFIGTINKNIESHFKDYYFRMRMKLMKIAKWKKDEFDQWFYVGISKSRLKDWVALNDKSNKAGWCWVWFEEVFARKQLDAVKYNAMHMYIFKVKMTKRDSKRWNVWIDKKKYRDVEFIGESVKYKFTPSDKHWKDIIKEFNETRDK